MYLSKLELHGFKSFASRTVVDYSPGITVVVGPNGCGKSNIVDAVRWVIGEQRARILRSEKMENVIFNGTQSRRALGMAEVLLTIENTRGILPIEYSEVTIGRRLYRSGDSEYLLNGTQCRLKDITDLFMDTGMGAGAYSVIELKMIEELLSDNAVDRRRLFEEAAGITKYKVRRAQTLRKLDSTQVDLTRVRDLTEELEKRVRSLERQAKKAAHYQEHKDRLDALEQAQAQHEYNRLQAEREQVAAKLREVRDLLEQDTARLSATEADHEALRKTHIEREQALVQAQTELAKHVDALRRAESDERLLRERVTVSERDIARLSQDREAGSLRATALEETRDQLEKAVAHAQPTADAAEEALQEAQAERDRISQKLEKRRSELNQLREAERRAMNARSEAQRQMERVSSRLEMVGDDLKGVRAQREELTDALATAERNAEAAVERADAADAGRAEALEARDAAAELRAQRTEALEAAQQTLRDAERGLDAAAAEVSLLESLLASYDDFSESVQYLAGQKNWTDRPIRSVADCLACDDEVRPALEAALGDFAGCLVVQDDAEAWRAISQLEQAEKGRTTFVVLDRLRPAVPVAAPVGLSALSTLVRPVDSELGVLRDTLLNNAFLADSIEAAREAAPGLAESARVITRKGEWVSGAGLVHAGSSTAAASSSPAASRIGRREQLTRARAAHESASASVDVAQQATDQAREALEAVGLADAEQALRTADEQAADARKARNEAEFRRDSLRRRSNELGERASHLESTSTRSTEELDLLAEQLSATESELKTATAAREEAEEGFHAIETENRAAVAHFSEAKVTAVQARNQLENLRRDQQRAAESLEQLEYEQEERSKRLVRLAEEKTGAAAELVEVGERVVAMRKEQGGFDRAVSAAKESLNETKANIADLEAGLRTLRRSREENMRQENGLAVRDAEIATRLEDIVASMLEDHDIDLAETAVEVPEDFEPREARSEIQELRSKIRNLGPVNALALETFEEERDRMEFMREQLTDLEGAESTLLETINEINTTASERFFKTFGAIQENFSRLFVELFGEDASAQVVLEDPDDPLESAIEIMAKPRGKKPSVLAQLSGGEKTLTAIALLFSIYLVKPSPFCILDEVDAPLDDANVDRFMHLIRTFADSTQFILVTHNKRTMQAADRMYGITMQEQGVSSLVGVSFEEEEGVLV